MYKEGQRILERQRYQFPSNWLYSDNVEGEWSAFSDILRRKDGAIQTQVRAAAFPTCAFVQIQVVDL